MTTKNKHLGDFYILIQKSSLILKTTEQFFFVKKNVHSTVHENYPGRRSFVTCIFTSFNNLIPSN